ncbi:MAG: acyl-CoA dehydrogenase C-terminal domain-containing protein, partial [Woeseiaceae bacterium]
LARLPDAPDGVKGISLFLVPKLAVNDDGSIGEPNGVSCGSIEHKMGINGSATCVLNFDNAKGYLLGGPNRGMRQMFTFINESRLMVAQQGHAAMERAYQGASEYARERLQMRAPVRVRSDKPADPIIVHPDVRRMLLTQRSLSEGVRLLVYYCAQQVDITHAGTPEQRERAETLLALLTPIVKGFSSEVANEAASYGIQVFGGHGYVREWGMEQIARDARITSIYEGTTGIQALDLLARKVLATEGKMLEPLVAEITGFIETNAGNADMQPMLDALREKLGAWVSLTREIGANAMKNPDEVNAAAFDYLMYSGYVTVAYSMARSAAVAFAADRNEYYQEKIDNVVFYFARLLPRTLTLAATIRSGESSIADLA